ncbi:envelope stress response protein PspG [Enterovibrio sp. ZSDZ42]|uniref:Envelope stress response protein PspG n=1 Tax=Enterovibrio gelatinilyticus TaxID=2899819 RepID=A0ABT5R0K0_9GAMM|nr:envelope stress response protein PspG [Enterovibrio sp. ZSDZ42]MDD1793808.1 envelope stress response protein PspG [Enterovibrio sp. ZSDZ42]
MIEFLFLVGFTIALLATGISFIGVIAAMVVGFVVMALAGMIGLVFKMLPWILLIAVVIWLLKGRDKTAQNARDYCYKRSRCNARARRY